MTDYHKIIATGEIMLKEPEFETDSSKIKEIKNTWMKQLDENLIGITTELSTVEHNDEVLGSLTFYWTGKSDFETYALQKVREIHENSLVIEDEDLHMGGWKLKIVYQQVNCLELKCQKRVVDGFFLKKNKEIEFSSVQVDEGPKVIDAVHLDEYMHLGSFDFVELRFMDSFTRPGIDAFIRSVQQEEHDFGLEDELSEKTYQFYSMIQNDEKAVSEIHQKIVGADMAFAALSTKDCLSMMDEDGSIDFLKKG